jgi:hypothetical protein
MVCAAPRLSRPLTGLVVAALISPPALALKPSGVRLRAGQIGDLDRSRELGLGLTFERDGERPPIRARHHHYALGLLYLPRVQVGESFYGVHFGPAWRLTPQWLGDHAFLEVGIAVGWLAHHRLGERDLGSRGHFVSHALLGWQRDPASGWYAGLRVRHTSNAGLATPNPGFNLLQLEYGVRLPASR